MYAGRLCLIVAGICLIALGVGLVGPIAADDGGDRVQNATENVDIDPTVATADGELTVIVQLEERSDRDATTAHDDQVASLRSHAAETQTAFERFADGNPHVEIERQFWITNAIVVTVDTEQVPIERLGMVDHVTAIAANTAVEATGHGVTTTTGDQTDAMPASYDTTYGLERINAPAVWDTFGTKGDGTKVAVLDTGYDPSYDDDIGLYTDDASDPTYPGGWAEFDRFGTQIDGSEPYDSGSHGTHVSGTVAGGDRSGEHIGVAPETELMHGLVLPDGTGTSVQVIAGIEWAVAEDADVVSMSLGTPCDSDDGGSEFVSTYIDPIENAKQSGTTVVASVGNDEAGCTGSPGNVYSAIAVGATDDNDIVADFSGGEVIDTETAWGTTAPSEWPREYTKPDIVAPGVGITSADPGSYWGDYSSKSGTSMAAPHVAGAIALLQSGTDAVLSPAAIRELLGATAEDLGVDEHRQGEGRLDVLEAVLEHSRATLEPTISPSEANVSEPTTIAIDVEHPIEQFHWAVDDEPVATSAEPTIDYEFDDLGATAVRVMMEDVGGETIEASTQVEVVDEVPPTANLEANRTDNVEVGLDAVEFDASGSTDNHEIERYEWAIDGEHVKTTDDPKIRHTFDEPGNRTVNLTVIDASGNENTTTANIEIVDTIDPTPALETPSTSIAGTGVTLNASESTDNHEIDQYEWEFGDGAAENTTDPVTTYTFEEAGEYTLNLTVSDPSGNTNTTETTLTVRNPPSVTVESPTDGTETSASNLTIDYELADTDIENATALEYRLDDMDAPDEEPVVDWTGGPFEPTEQEQSFAVHTGELADGNYTVSLRLLDDDGSVLPYDTATDETNVTVKATPPALSLDVQPVDENYPEIGPENPAIVNATTTDHRHESTTVTITTSTGAVVTHWDLSNETGGGESVELEWPAIDETNTTVESGEYEITATAIDDLGNENTSSVTRSVDTDAPTISVDSIDGEHTDEDLVYVADTTTLTVAGTADDGQPDPGEVDEVSIVLDAAFTNYQRTTTATVNETEGTWIATIDPETLPDEGQYNVRAETVDSAKNENKETADESIAYDRSAPRLGTVIADYDRSATEASVEVRSDAPLNGDPAINVTGPEGADVMFDGPTDVDGSPTQWTGTFDVTENGTYTLNASGTDRAGNHGTNTSITTIDPAATVENRTVTIYNDRTGAFITINTTNDVDESFVTFSETQSSPHPLESDTIGVEFLTTELGDDLDSQIANATVGIPTTESRLPGNVTTEDDRVGLQWYNESQTTWQEQNLSVRDFDPDDADEPIEGEYWTATVDEVSTYGVVVEDDSPPGLVDVKPADGETLDHDTAAVPIELQYEDDISGIDPSSIDLYVDDEQVTDDDRTQITSGATTFRSLAVESGDSYDIRLEIADEADNEALFETGFAVATEEEDDDTGGGPIGLPPAPASDEPDHPEPTAVIDVDLDPATVGEEVTFSGADSVDDGYEISSYEWEINGEIFHGEVITTSFDEAGKYDINLTVGNNLGEQDTATATVTVEEEDHPPETDETSPADEEPADEEESIDESADADDSIPGFGLTAAIGGLLSLVLVTLQRRN